MNYLNHLQIIEKIYKELSTTRLTNNIGLHAGSSGIALFIAYYDRIVNREESINQRILDIINHNIECINLGERQQSICSGISGFGWLCEHLKNLHAFNEKNIEFLKDLDVYLFSKMILDIKNGNYDYLHGALGVGTYFLTRFYRKEISDILILLLCELEKSGTHCENGAIKWISNLNIEGKKGCNISLSHGMSSIAAFLIRLHQIKFEVERVDKLLIQTIVYIIDQITYTDNSISFFPTYSKESSLDNHYSRLGWCYGDLGISYILLEAALVLNNKEWEIIALRILLHSCKRRDLHKNGIRDAGLCHGSAGISHIFWNLYLKTQIQEFRIASDYWLNITMQMFNNDDELLGFKAWRTEESGGPIISNTLLEGLAGIGLAFLSRISGDKLSWDECIMLN